MRLVFTQPIELDREAKLFRDKIDEYNGVLSEDVLCTFLATIFYKPTPRDIRKIAERYNKRKYLNCDNSVKYHKIKGNYHKVIKGSERASLVLNKIKFDMIATAKTYKIYLEDFGSFEDDTNAMQINMMSKLISSLEEETV